MKLFKRPEYLWPWWNGLWTGFAIGFCVCVSITEPNWGAHITLWLLPACLLISYLPEAIRDISAMVRRYRQAAKH
jgi:hypothetical protein